MKNLIPTIFVALAIIGCSCDTTEPPIDIEPPGRRDYTWEIDTLNIPLAHFERIWGSSPSDVWIIGGGGGLDRTIFHFDGNEWKNDGISRGINPSAIWGFGSDNVWIGGFGGFWNYDGSVWKKVYEFRTPTLNWVGILDIWGTSSNNIYATGVADSNGVRKGMLFHYNGINWQRVNIGFTSSTLMRIKHGSKTSSNYFMWGLVENDFGRDTTKIFEFDGINLIEISNSLFSNNSWNFVQEIDKEVIFTIGRGLYRFNNRKFNLIVENPFTNNYEAIYGRNWKDIFWAMRDGVTHFNGTDIQYVLNFESGIRIAEGIVFNSHVFFLTNNNKNGSILIFRGTLK